ncbi:MAG: hypothetical protein MJ211_00945 [Bacteroidales bacterium]|nr:hypothetical protein [Bacteroidales bacterium]
MTKIITILFLFLSLSVFSQQKNGIVFTFSFDDKPLILNEFRENSIKDMKYCICQSQYFISNIKLINKDGSEQYFSNKIHYVDAEIPSTLQWFVDDNFSLENVEYLTFTFGFDSISNRSYMFKNPPENLMFWPDYLGGGYHYMKTNIRFVDNFNESYVFNCHIGRGQVYDEENEPISYIDNDFSVTIPIKTTKINDNDFAIINLNLAKLFDSHSALELIDLRGIMNNQKAMKMFSEELKNAFE